MDNPSFRLESVVREKNELVDFEGPLSLILTLLQKNKIEIRDISVSEILDQYMAWISDMQKMDLEVSSEFIRMAAYLLYIKTKTLLSTGEEEVTELEMLMESLEALKCKDMLAAVKEVTPDLLSMYEKGALLYSKAPEPPPASAGEYCYTHSPVELLKAIAGICRETGEPAVDYSSVSSGIPKRIIFSVRDKTRQILSRLRLRNISLSELYEECSSRSEIVATFVSVLELCSMGSITVSATRKGDGYELSFTGGDVDEIIEKIDY